MRNRIAAALLAVCTLGFALPGMAEDPVSLPFTIEFSGNANVPTIKVINNSSVRLTKFKLYIGRTEYQFDEVSISANPEGGKISAINQPSPNTQGDYSYDNWIELSLTGWDPGENLAVTADIDYNNSNSYEDYRQILLAGSAYAVVEGGGVTEILYLPNVANKSLSSYSFQVQPPRRSLIIKSHSEDGTEFVRRVTLKVNGVVRQTEIGEEVTIPDVFKGDRIEIIAPREVYRNIFGQDITDSASNDPEMVQSEAEERFTAVGITVNNQAQTGDPTLYEFDIDSDARVVVKWQHSYALSIHQDFIATQSMEKDSLGKAWAGPLTSWASGNPIPNAKKHWITKGETVIAEIDGQVVDFTRPGLDIRYVPEGYKAFGPPNSLTSESMDTTARLSGTDIRTNVNHLAEFNFTVGQQPPDRQQVRQFTMYGPGAISYLWQIQFGVRVNVDDVARTSLPKVYLMTTTNVAEFGSGDGTFWFNPGASIKVASAANVTDANSTALKGWINGDGYYFTSKGDLDDTKDGVLIDGGAGVKLDGSPSAVWDASFYDPGTGKKYRGMEIPGIQRAARVMWRYGAPAIAVNVTIGEYVFQADSAYEGLFTTQPSSVETIKITGENKNVDPADLTVWDPVSAKLYPVVPGLFRISWQMDGPASNQVDVLATVTWPSPSHYSHVCSTPPVSLDPDPADNLIFKELKYRENDSVVAGESLFTASTPGKSVFIFSEIQRVGRGIPREYVKVRVAESRRWNDRLPEAETVIVGRKITDAADQAGLETGYLMFTGGRHNPFIYDSSKLEALAAKDIYDTDALRLGTGPLIVQNKDRLPGPIIPVNLHPGATQTQRLVVVWYADPRLNDQIMWPYAARTYLPRWPIDASEGLGRIVIASQYGSESVAADGSDQVVVGPVTNVVADGNGGWVTNVVPAETILSPSRLQQVSVYNQPDRASAGYNPNEEHALLAGSLRYAELSPRPPAVYAMRHNDLNSYTASSLGESSQSTEDYSSHPFVLIQFFDTAVSEFGMRVYQVIKEDRNLRGYRFADAIWLKSSTPVEKLNSEPHVTMEAGEPVIPFYPLGVVIGAAPCPETFGNNVKNQVTYWEDHRGSSWSVSGGANAWFTHSVFYPLAPDFWWPAGRMVPPVTVSKLSDGTAVAIYDTTRSPAVPGVGDSVAFLPPNVLATATAANLASHIPVEVLFKSDWPDVVPLLKAGETLTFSGGEYRADHPTMVVADGEGTKTVQTPGLPAVLGFAAAEVVFDALNPTGNAETYKQSWTARIAQVLDYRRVALSLDDFPSELAPATGRTRVSQGLYIFTELPASLQKRVRYDPLNGDLVFFGLVNDKDIGESTLTAAPPAVYVLEPNIMTLGERDALQALDDDLGTAWDAKIEALYQLSRNPNQLKTGSTVIQDQYLVGLDRNSAEPTMPLRAFGPGLALLPNAGFLNPNGTIPNLVNPGSPGLPYPEFSYVTVVENNDPSLGGSPITPHVIKVSRDDRYRGAIKTVLSDNVFDENMVLRHTGDFGANADVLVFEWWYRPDDGSLDVPPPDQIPAGQTNPWKLFSDPSGNDGLGRFLAELKGNPNAPETLLADTWWFARYRHINDVAADTNWKMPQPNGDSAVNFMWAGAGNSDPFNDMNGDGRPDYRAQLAMGWIKRVLDAVNPYEARIRDFEGDNPATVSSMITQLGPRFEGPVALNPDKNVIENVGLIELYETILKRARDLSIDLSRPVSTPAIANALQLASTRLADFYTLLGNEAYVDALDPTIGFGSDSVEYGSLAPAVFTFQNQMSSLIEEELALLHGVDDYFARPVYNRLFWNFTKGEGEAAYALSYNVNDINQDGFIDEDDAMVLYPQGHGDAWGHYLTALGKQYDLLNHEYFNWVSRSEYYNLMDIVIKVDFLDERKFAQTAAAKAKVGAEIVDLTYRQKYVDDPNAQWQGYGDSLKDRSWGVQDWARRAAQGAYFDWVMANALLPSQHPNTTLEGVQKVDRESNGDLAVISANLNAVQRTLDESNRGFNPLGLAGNAVPFDINTDKLNDLVFGNTHFEQVYERAVLALANAAAVWDNANETRNMLRQVANTEEAFRNSVFQEDLTYRNSLIEIFGRPYEGSIGPGKLYPAGYDGPDLALFMYVNVREIDSSTVPGPSTAFAAFDSAGNLTSGDIYNAFNKDDSDNGYKFTSMSASTLRLLASTFAQPANDGSIPAKVEDGWYAVNYTDLTTPKVGLDGLTDLMPVTAAGYTFQAPDSWGNRLAAGELQSLISQMIQQEAEVAKAIGAWDALTGEIVRTIRLVNAKLATGADVREKKASMARWKCGVQNTIKGIMGVIELLTKIKDTTYKFADATQTAIPRGLPTAGLAFSPGDALSAAASGIKFVEASTFTGLKAAEGVMKAIQIASEIGLDIAQMETDLWVAEQEASVNRKEFAKEVEDLVGDEPVLRIAVFKEIETLRELSDRYRALLDKGVRLIDERAAFNKRVAAQTQRSRYQDMTFRVSRNHALKNYRATFDIAARYAYLAAKVYDYETNLDPSDPGSPRDILADIVKARSVGQFDGAAQLGGGGLAEAMARLNANYMHYKSQLGFNNPQIETGKMSLRTELFRILPKGSVQPDAGFPNPGQDSDALWRTKLQECRVDDLWMLPEFRYYCRSFIDESAGPQPAIVIRFGSEIVAGRNFFGRPLSGGDHAYDPSHFATKVRSVGLWFSDYLSGDVVNDLPSTPRVYLIPAGSDVMSVSSSDDPGDVRVWDVVDQQIPVPYPALSSVLDNSAWIPLLDSLNGRIGDPRKFPQFRAYHDGTDVVDMDELVGDTRLVGRSVWNTQWMLVIPGTMLNADPNEGLRRFIEQVSDIKLVFQTYGLSGN